MLGIIEYLIKITEHRYKVIEEEKNLPLLKLVILFIH